MLADCAALNCNGYLQIPILWKSIEKIKYCRKTARQNSPCTEIIPGLHNLVDGPSGGSCMNPVKLQYPPGAQPCGGGGPKCSAPMGRSMTGAPGGILTSGEELTRTGCGNRYAWP
jgi:hypothetical protein